MYSFIYLASKSPRRQQLLQQIAVPFKLLEQDVREQSLENENALNFVSRLAREKALSSYHILQKKQLELAPVLGADTIVVINDNGNEKILGKPVNKDHAMEILTLLSAGTHRVLTAICVTDGDKLLSSVSNSTVSFKKLSSSEINNYWHTGEPVDKAGAYAIQGKAAAFITKISGSYSGIMGLPLYETASLLQQFDLSFSFNQTGS